LRRLLLPLLLVLGGLAFAQAGSGVTIEARVFDIARQLRCPICVSESVAASSSQIAVTMREEIQELVQAGLTDQEILASFTESYGDWVLLEPPRRGLHLLVWLLPAVVAVVGLIMLVGFMRRSVKAGSEDIEVNESDLKRLRQLMDEEQPGEQA